MHVSAMQTAQPRLDHLRVVASLRGMDVVTIPGFAYGLRLERGYDLGVHENFQGRPHRSIRAAGRSPRPAGALGLSAPVILAVGNLNP
jgi:hypothetical protein